MVERARILVRAAMVNGIGAARARVREQAGLSRSPGHAEAYPVDQEALLALDPKHELLRSLVRELAYLLNALGDEERLQFSMASYGTDVIPKKVHLAVYRYLPPGEWVVHLPKGFQVLAALNEYAKVQTLAPLLLTDDAGTVYAAARRLIEWAHGGPYPFLESGLGENLREDLSVALERWKDEPRIYPLLERLYRLPWDKPPAKYDIRMGFTAVRNEYQKVLVDALREAGETLTPEEKEDVLESMRKGGFYWGIKVLYSFGAGAKEAFIEALIRGMDRFGKEARRAFADEYGDIEDLRPALSEAGEDLRTHVEGWEN